MIFFFFASWLTPRLFSTIFVCLPSLVSCLGKRLSHQFSLILVWTPTLSNMLLYPLTIPNLWYFRSWSWLFRTVFRTSSVSLCAVFERLWQGKVLSSQKPGTPLPSRSLSSQPQTRIPLILYFVGCLCFRSSFHQSVWKVELCYIQKLNNVPWFQK